MIIAVSFLDTPVTAIIQIFIAVVIAEFLWMHNVHASSDLDAIRPAIHRRFSLVGPQSYQWYQYNYFRC